MLADSNLLRVDVGPTQQGLHDEELYNSLKMEICSTHALPLLSAFAGDLPECVACVVQTKSACLRHACFICSLSWHPERGS